MPKDCFARPEDICAHTGEDYARYEGAVSPPVFQTSMFLDGGSFEYSRVTNPTLEVFEEKVAALEHAGGDGRALVYSSGSAAITSVLLSTLRAGAHVIMVRTCYGSARGFSAFLERYGVQVTFVRGTEPGEFEEALRPETALIYLESPSSCVFDLQDIRAVSELAHAHGIPVAIDNTYSTPIFQRPLELGADLVIHSATKYFGGHSDALAGVVIGRGERIRRLSAERSMLGNITPPMQAWLLTRGLRTLPLRMKAAYERGLAVARFLEAHPKVERVFYPALESHPQHELFVRQMQGAGSLMSFIPRGSYESRAEMLSRFRVFSRAQSWGGYESLIYPLGVLEPPTELSTRLFGGGVFRLYAGLEDTDTLLDDLDRALSALKD